MWFTCLIWRCSSTVSVNLLILFCALMAAAMFGILSSVPELSVSIVFSHDNTSAAWFFDTVSMQYVRALLHETEAPYCNFTSAIRYLKDLFQSMIVWSNRKVHTLMEYTWEQDWLNICEELSTRFIQVRYLVCPKFGQISKYSYLIVFICWNNTQQMFWSHALTSMVKYPSLLGKISFSDVLSTFCKICSEVDCSSFRFSNNSSLDIGQFSL